MQACSGLSVWLPAPGLSIVVVLKDFGPITSSFLIFQIWSSRVMVRLTSHSVAAHAVACSGRRRSALLRSFTYELSTTSSSNHQY
ncbi:hypothetical protein BDR03DRAFT_53073 [Suillus americanus]|nr:hypothetical protein BDR03DRAFT_53073 [Suillus americanus]